MFVVNEIRVLMQAGEAQDPDSGLVSIPTSFLKDHGSASEAFSAEQQNGN